MEHIRPKCIIALLWERWIAFDASFLTLDAMLELSNHSGNIVLHLHHRQVELCSKPPIMYTEFPASRSFPYSAPPSSYTDSNNHCMLCVRQLVSPT
jgi:hypothetical protein